jgi:hypothetical protein
MSPARGSELDQVVFLRFSLPATRCRCTGSFTRHFAPFILAGRYRRFVIGHELLAAVA